MHFWIDKRSQCAYSGRHRVPPSLSLGAGRARGRVCLGAHKGMAAPVHRFASVDCPPRRPHRPHRHYGPPPMPTVHSARRQTEDTSLYVEIPPEPTQPTIASLAAARSVTPDTLLRTAALGLHNTPMMAPHLKFGMLVSFALATLFLAGAKYYFDKQVVRSPWTGGEAGAACAAVMCVCGVVCALSLRRRPRDPPRAPERVSSTAQRDLPPPPEPSDEISLATLLQSPEPSNTTTGTAPGDASEAPPPYHIAVLLPPRVASPPAYSALS